MKANALSASLPLGLQPSVVAKDKCGKLWFDSTKVQTESADVQCRRTVLKTFQNIVCLST